MNDDYFFIECVLLPVYKMRVLLFEFGFEVTVGQTVTFQLCDFLLQVTDLKKKAGRHYLGKTQQWLRLKLELVLCL